MRIVLFALVAVSLSGCAALGFSRGARERDLERRIEIAERAAATATDEAKVQAEIEVNDLKETLATAKAEREAKGERNISQAISVVISLVSMLGLGVKT